MRGVGVLLLWQTCSGAAPRYKINALAGTACAVEAMQDSVVQVRGLKNAQ